ncbi:MAG: hypothetical protein KTR24_12680 [Saprospiraceae bacterium]|nr:hypothetical protein [Saprospiraceae bacterium]
MQLRRDWAIIRKHFNRNFSSNFHVSIASTDTEGMPTCTPIGTLFLNRDFTGFYFEKYPKSLPSSANDRNSVCVLSVNSRALFWLTALFRGGFRHYPGMKLYGLLGRRRPATEIEKSRLRKRMKVTAWTVGNRRLWGDMDMVRELTFNRVEPIELGDMTLNAS